MNESQKKVLDALPFQFTTDKLTLTITKAFKAFF